MVDGIQDVSKTGKIRRSDLMEPRLRTERMPSENKKNDVLASASTTGIMPIFSEPADDTAEREEDLPAE